MLLHTFLRDTDGIGQFLRGVLGMSFEQLEDFLLTFNILTSQTAILNIQELTVLLVLVVTYLYRSITTKVELII